MRIFLLTLLLLSSLTFAQETQKHGEFLGGKIVEELPSWFKTSFLDFSEDLDEARDDGKHVKIYFHQNGCPYCAKLVEDNFHNEALVAKLRKNFDTIQTNMWGDRDLTDWNGVDYTEKEFASKMKIQFTPTLVFLNSQGDSILRLNGYQSVAKMHTVLDYVANKNYLNESFANYTNRLKKDRFGVLNPHPIFQFGPHILTRSNALPASQYLAVFFEEPNCQTCDKFYQNLMPLKTTQNYLAQMQVVRFDALSSEKLITPAGKKTTAAKWYENLKLTYKPAIVFFDKKGQEIIRIDAFFKAYHTHGVMTYVLSGAYKNQPNFQRYLEDKSDKLREQGTTVDIWQ
jgi:thioredoxin-related protein